MPNPSDLRFPLSAAAQRIIADITYPELAEDGVIDAQEMQEQEFTRDTFEAAGILPGQKVSGEAALLIANSQLSPDQYDRYDNLAADHLLNRQSVEESVVLYGKTAARYAKEGKYFSAFSSMMAAVKLSKNLEEAASSEGGDPKIDAKQAALSTQKALDYLLADPSIKASGKMEFARVKAQWIKENGSGKNPDIQFAVDLQSFTALKPDLSFALGLMKNDSRFGEVLDYLPDYLRAYSVEIDPQATSFDAIPVENAVWIAEQIGDAAFLSGMGFEYRKATLALAAGLHQAGLSREKAVVTAKDFSVEVKGGRDPEMKMATVAILARMGVDFDSAKELALSARVMAEQSHSTHVFEDDSLAYAAQEVWATGIHDPADLKGVLSVLNRYGIDGSMVSICTKEELLSFKSRGVVDAFLAITERYTLDPKSQGQGSYIFSQLAESLNHIHDRNVGLDKTDAMRTEIASKMSPLMAYRLLAQGGEDLYTSSYQKVMKGFNSKVKQEDLGKWLSTQDRRGEHLSDFMQILARFDDLDLIKAAPAEFTPALLDLVEVSWQLDSGKAARLVSVFGALLPKMSFVQKERMQTIFSQGISDPRSELEYSGSLAYILRSVAETQNKNILPALSKLAASLPALHTPKVPIDEWLKGETPTLTAKLYFYSDERWFGESVNHYISKGFKRDDAEMEAKRMDGKTTISLVREQNGIKQKIILTNDPMDNRVASLNDPEIDIIVHRGHSYHLEKTFPIAIDVSTASTKLIFGGSCGSYGDMSSSEFLQTYGKHLLMSDSDTGEGAVNNAVLLEVFDGVAKGKTEWSDYRLQGFVSKRGLKPPNDPSVLAGRYISDFIKWEPAKKEAVTMPGVS